MIEAFYGEVILWAGTWIPEDWALCDGSFLPVCGANAALFSIIGIRFGGDGTHSFALPKLDAPAPGLRYIICTNGLYPQHP